MYDISFSFRAASRAMGYDVPLPKKRVCSLFLNLVDIFLISFFAYLLVPVLMIAKGKKATN